MPSHLQVKSIHSVILFTHLLVFLTVCDCVICAETQVQMQLPRLKVRTKNTETRSLIGEEDNEIRSFKKLVG